MSGRCVPRQASLNKLNRLSEELICERHQEDSSIAGHRPAEKRLLGIKGFANGGSHGIQRAVSNDLVICFRAKARPAAFMPCPHFSAYAQKGKQDILDGQEAGRKNQKIRGKKNPRRPGIFQCEFSTLNSPQYLLSIRSVSFTLFLFL